MPRARPRRQSTTLQSSDAVDRTLDGAAIHATRADVHPPGGIPVLRPALLLVAALVGLLLAPPAAEAGTIEGRLILEEQRSRLLRGPYPVGGVVRRVESLPAVAMLLGPVRGNAAPRDGQPVRVVQRDTAFHPAVVVVGPGTSVAFPNDDPFFHNVFSYSRPRRFDLGRYPRGESKSVRFDSPGIVKIFCEIHNWMRGAVVVTENPFHALVGVDGRFRITDVPAGRHRLRIWHFDRGETEVEVVVPETGTVRVELTL
jgi:plastocyanin